MNDFDFVHDKFDSYVFTDAAIAPETREMLTRMEAIFSVAPSVVDTPVSEIRAARASGKAVLPIVRLEAGSTATISGPAGDIALRIFEPLSPRGALLHFHGGGFVMGGPDQQDELLHRFAQGTGLAVVSAGYRLAPENVFPAAVEDAVAAARWLASAVANGRFGGKHMVVGGESAGAYLSLQTMLHLRDVDGNIPFSAAYLAYGGFDLGMTPSVRNWGDRFMLLSTPVIEKYARLLLPPDADRSCPKVSPLYADLSGLPPLHIFTGTVDPLIDDSLFLSQRVRAAGGVAELAIYPGGIHGFNVFPFHLAEIANSNIVAFINRQTRDT